jgi:hypothetical protein
VVAACNCEDLIMAGFWSRKWGEFPQREYQIWYGMMVRCYDRRAPNFSRYGGRGIRVCDRWRDDFMAFLSDMRPRPSPAYSLDRLDNDADYTPENCRWATRYQQAHNREFMREAVGVERHRRRWAARIMIGGHRTLLGNFETFAEARRAYRQAALRSRIVAELSAAWAHRPEHGRADDGSLDSRLLNLLLEVSRSRGASGRRKSPAHYPRDRTARGKSAPAPRSQRPMRRTSAERKPRAKRS